MMIAINVRYLKGPGRWHDCFSARGILPPFQLAVSSESSTPFLNCSLSLTLLIQITITYFNSFSFLSKLSVLYIWRDILQKKTLAGWFDLTVHWGLVHEPFGLDSVAWQAARPQMVWCLCFLSN